MPPLPCGKIGRRKCAAATMSSGFEHVRFHALLSDELFTLTCQDEQLLYSFFNADRIIDFLLSIGMRPFIELSFMPETLASGNVTVFSYRANVTPPRDYDQWAALIQKISAHWVDRYGAQEVRQWFFEVWNEPNLKAFWTGTQDEYFELYRRTAEALKAVDPALKVGGPATANNEWIQEFLDFCTNEFSARRFRQHPSLPHRRLRSAGRGYHHSAGACAARHHAGAGSQVSRRSAWLAALLHGMEHLLESARSYARRAFRRRIRHQDRHGGARTGAGYSFWTFSDIFSENYFPSVPFHGGFGILNLHGIAKPTYRAFQLLHHLGTEFMEVHGTHETVDAWVVRKGGTRDDHPDKPRHASASHPNGTGEFAALGRIRATASGFY